MTKVYPCGDIGEGSRLVTKPSNSGDEDEISDFILDLNMEKRSLSCNLARNGNRRNGRWARNTLDNGQLSDG